MKQFLPFCISILSFTGLFGQTCTYSNNNNEIYGHFDDGTTIESLRKLNFNMAHEPYGAYYWDNTRNVNGTREFAFLDYFDECVTRNGSTLNSEHVIYRANCIQKDVYVGFQFGRNGGDRYEKGSYNSPEINISALRAAQIYYVITNNNQNTPGFGDAIWYLTQGAEGVADPNQGAQNSLVTTAETNVTSPNGNEDLLVFYTDNGSTAYRIQETVRVTALEINIGNLVWADVNDNGVLDGNENGIPGLTVNLYKDYNGDGVRDFNTPMRTTTTDANGNYSFIVTDANYIVEVVAPDYLVGTNTGNTDPALNDSDDNGVDVDGNTISSKTFRSGQRATLSTQVEGHNKIDFGLVPKVALGNAIFMDTNNNGSFDNGEMGLDGVDVDLYEQGAVVGVDNPILSTTTSNGGYYLFDNIPSGTYFVHIPSNNFGSGQVLENKSSSTVEGGDTDTDDDVDENGLNTTVNGGISSGPINLTAGEEPTNESGSTSGAVSSSLPDSHVNLTVDFGFYTQSVAIGNLVFMDNDEDGMFDTEEMGIDGVTVELYMENDVVGTDSPVQSTTTSDGGFYIFDQIEPGNYFVHISGSNFGPNSPLEGKKSSQAEGGDSNSDDDADENGQNTLVQGGISSSIINLEIGNEPTGETGATSNSVKSNLADNNVNTTVDFGFYSPLLAIGNLVFMDNDNDGIFDNDEMGIDGVTVELYKENDNIGSDSPVQTTTTADGGFYIFDLLEPGSYIVHIPASNFSSGNSLENKLSSFVQGIDDGIDDNADENGQNTLVQGGISSTVITLTEGDEPTNEAGANSNIVESVLDDNDVNTTVDFGFYTPQVAVGNVVFMDNDKDGIFDNDEMGIDGVSVELYKENDNIGSDSPVQTTTTADGGFYIFDLLEPGNYIVHIPASNFTSGNPLDAKKSSDAEGGDDSNDDDANENGQNTLVQGGVSSTVIALAEGSEPTAEAGATSQTVKSELDDDDVNTTVDFGFYTPQVAVGNVVFMDNDKDGIFDNDEMGIDGVSVELYKENDNIGSDSPVQTTTTTDGGFYIFDLLEPGNYIVHIPASNFTSGSPLDAKKSSDAEGGDDSNDDDANENGQNSLVQGGVSSTVIALAEGDEPTAEAGATSQSVKSELDDDDVNTTVDFGFYTPQVAVGNVVFMDNDKDGIFDNDEMGIDGVSVELYKENDNIGSDSPVQTTTTADGGFYIFDLLEPGNYIVHIPASNFSNGNPLDAKKSSDAEGGDDSNDDDANENGQNTLVQGGVSSTVIALAEGDEPTAEAGATSQTVKSELDDDDVNTTVDFGFYTPQVAVGNVVFMDNDKDGIFDNDEMGIDGVSIELYKENDNIGSDSPVQTTTTADGGFYIFDLLEPGNYIVHIPASNFTSGNPLDAKKSSDAEGDDDSNDDDANENGQNTLVQGGVSSTVIALAEGSEPTAEAGATSQTVKSELDDDDVNTTVDFGFYTPQVAVGNVVFMDNDKDGIFDNDEMGIDGVSVELYKENDNIGSDSPVQTTTTADGGFYIFDLLEPGNYIVHIPASNFTSGNPLDAKKSSDAEGGDDSNDDDANENGQNSLVQGGVSSTVIALAEGDEPTAEAGATSQTVKSELDDDDVNTTVDFGFYTPQVAVGNVVFMDNDNDGIFDNDEMGIDGVSIALYKENDNIGSDSPVQTTTTADGGFYIFDLLEPGNYIVHIPASNFTSGNALDGKLSSDVQGGDDTNDDNANENGQNTTEFGGISSTVIALSEGEEPTNEGGASSNSVKSDLDDEDVNLTVDFGFYNNPVLPITLLDFSARSIKENVVLEWTTTDEVNFSGFEIQRSQDGRSFGQIGFVNSKGGGEYSYTDKPNTNNNDILYYRLKSVDYDGRYELSQLVSVVIAGQSDFKIYPSPATAGPVYITGQAIRTVDIYSPQGELLISNRYDGVNTVTIDLPSLPSGMYVAVVNQTKRLPLLIVR